MASSASDSMTDQRRALLTEREREILNGEADVTTNYRYSVESRVRKRIRDRLADDVNLLREQYPEMFDDLIFPIVCQPGAEEVETDVDAAPDSGAEPEQTPAPEPTHTREPETEPAAVNTADVSADVREAVEKVATSWEDSDERLQTRKAAAAIVLEHALESDEAVGKSSDVVDQVRNTHAVDGQNAETYWRKNIRPVLKAYGQYNQGRHGYTVDSLDK